MVAALIQHLEEHKSEAPFTIVDLCSGFGFVSLFLSDLLDPAIVAAIHLLDRRWPMRGQARSSEDAQSCEHIEAGCWRVPLLTRKVDIRKAREQRQLTEHLFERASGRVAILGVHLCGSLSCNAVDIFLANPSVGFLGLKPCCLPGKAKAQRAEQWTLGHHTFTASEIYSVEAPCEPCAEEETEAAGLVALEPSAQAALGAPNSAMGLDGEAASEAESAAPPASVSRSAKERAAHRREKDSGRPSRSAEAIKRRELRRKERQRERRDVLRLQQQQVGGGAALAPAPSENPDASPEDDPTAVASMPADKPSHHMQMEVRQGSRLLRTFASHLLEGLNSLCDETRAQLQEHIVQPHHFQNLFIFAERPPRPPMSPR